MKTEYFKAIIQKTAEGKSILVAVIPDDMLGLALPQIAEVQCFKIPATIYTGTYPQIKVNTDTVKEREDLKGMGIAGIVTTEGWYNKTIESEDFLGISLDK